MMRSDISPSITLFSKVNVLVEMLDKYAAEDSRIASIFRDER